MINQQEYKTLPYESSDAITYYHAGADALIAHLGQHHARYVDSMVLAQRLRQFRTIHGDIGDVGNDELSTIVQHLDAIACAEHNTTLYALGKTAMITQQQNRWVFTAAENALRDHIPDQNLRASLTSIRQTVDYVWSNPAYRHRSMPFDFGIAYCKRLVDQVSLLLQANESRPLSMHEIYLLLVGIYLHGIGMVCDEDALPTINAHTVQHTNSQGCVISPSHQQLSPPPPHQSHLERRYKCYPFLSAAWVDYAHRTGETELGPAAMTIPSDLLDDVMDICRYHTWLPIANCPLTCKFEPSGRKQLIVALLRTAYNMDVISHCVPYHVIATLTPDTRAATHWWLYHHAHVSFVARNSIRLTLTLHPNDMSAFATCVHTRFITEFQSKSLATWHILATNGFSLQVDAQSGTIANNYAALLPTTITDTIATLRTSHSSLFDLVDEVRSWLRAIRYEVSEPEQLSPRCVELHATIDLGSLRQHVRIRCISQYITPADVDALHDMLNMHTPQGWIISDHRISDLVQRRVADYDAIGVFHLADFLHQHMWAPYFNRLMALVTKEQLKQHYVDMGCSITINTHDIHDANELHQAGEYHSMLEQVDVWLTHAHTTLLTVLGTAGSGKTWFSRWYAHRQLLRFLRDPITERLPLLITLRDIEDIHTTNQLINDVLLHHYRLLFVGSACDMIVEMNRRGKLLFILDGIDEMITDLRPHAIMEGFTRLAGLVVPQSKMIITCRTSFAQSIEAIYPTITATSPLPITGSIMHMHPFTHEQIAHVLQYGTKQRSSSVQPCVLHTPHLAAMAQVPAHTQLLLAALQHHTCDAIHHLAHVYLYATAQLCCNDATTTPARRTLITPHQTLYFFCEIAWEMLSTNRMRLHYSAFPPRIYGYFQQQLVTQQQRDIWDDDLRSQSLLQHNASGYYEFLHKSVLEYFVALKFALELGILDPSFLRPYYRLQAVDNEMNITPPITPLPLHELNTTFGAIALSDDRLSMVLQLLPHMLSPCATKQLWHVVDATRGKTPEQVRYAGSNALTLLHRLGEPLQGVNLTHTVLTRALLDGADLSQADMSHAILARANLSYACLREATMHATYLREAILYGCNIERAQMHEATLVNVQLFAPHHIVPPMMTHDETDAKTIATKNNHRAQDEIVCRGANITGARGIDQHITLSTHNTGHATPSTITIRDFFLARGGIIEEPQKS